MKTMQYKYIFLLWIAVTVLAGCRRYSDGDEEYMSEGGTTHETRSAFLSVDVSLSSADEENYVSTLRLFVFDNASTGYPTLDLNEVQPVDAKSEKLHALLNVKANSDIAVAAVVNEPASMTSMLNTVMTLEQLELVAGSFAEIFNSNGTGKNPLAPALLLPMCGLKRGVVVTSANNTEANACQVGMHVDRSVAKVTLYVQCAAATLGEYKLKAGTTVFTLRNTYASGYLATGTEEDQTRFQSNSALNFGRMQSVDAAELQPKSWIVPTDVTVSTTPVSLVSFYLAERTCLADEEKLSLRIENVEVLGTYHNYGKPILKITDVSSTERDFEMIRRNYEYKIYCTLGIYDLNLDILEWNMAEVNADILGTYLDFTADSYVIPPTEAGSVIVGSIDIPFKTDASVLYIDWTALTGVERVGTAVSADVTSLPVIGGEGTIHLQMQDVAQVLTDAPMVIQAGNIRRTLRISTQSVWP